MSKNVRIKDMKVCVCVCVCACVCVCVCVCALSFAQVIGQLLEDTHDCWTIFILWEGMLVPQFLSLFSLFSLIASLSDTNHNIDVFSFWCVLMPKTHLICDSPTIIVCLQANIEQIGLGIR